MTRNADKTEYQKTLSQLGNEVIILIAELK